MLVISKFPCLLVTAQDLGLQTPLAFLDPQAEGEKLLYGSNFASSGSGWLESTAEIFVRTLHFSFVIVKQSPRRPALVTKISVTCLELSSTI